MEVVDGGNYVEVMTKGFMMKWIAPYCTECKESGGRCGSNGYDLQCYCPFGDQIHARSCPNPYGKPSFFTSIRKAVANLGYKCSGVQHVLKRRKIRGIKYASCRGSCYRTCISCHSSHKETPGFTHPDYPNHVCRLKRAIYGLKQAPRAWYARLSRKLLELGFHSCRADPSLFCYTQQNVSLYMLIYVDDIIVTGSSTSAIDNLINQLAVEFPVKRLGELSYFLGIEVAKFSDGIHLSQRKYITDLLESTHMINAKPVQTPMASSTVLSATDGRDLADPKLYRSVVGSLQYLSFTRPDISFAVNKVCQFLHAPKDSHWSAVKRILRYLKHTMHHGLLIRKSATPQLRVFSDTESPNIAAFSDADWAGCPDDRKSTGGFCIFFGDNLISWSSKKQQTIARSTTEAEYKALALTTCEVIWIQLLLQELGIYLPSPPTLYCDNIGASYLATNPVINSRVKHLDLDYYFVRDRVSAKSLNISVVSSKNQLADIFTKPLPSIRFNLLRSSLTVRTLPFGSRGDTNVDVENFLKNHEFLYPKRYTYSQVKKMTNSFEVKLGQGGFGSVYKGVQSNGNLVAVKVLSELKGNGEDFVNEVASVGKTCHINIVSLVGFCSEGHQRALIYEFMANGSLEKFIYDQTSSNSNQLGWEKLFQIAIGIARGLEYLHSGCSTRILHFDIKPHNILLDKDFCPKISDFGLAKLFPAERSMISMSRMRGTPGYIAPELLSINFGHASHKSDVYSYGMMILEMVGGRKNIEVEVDHTSEIYFPHWIYKKVELHDEKLELHGIVSDEENEMAKKMIIVGMWCIQTNPLSRPTITKVLEMLEGDLASMETPPKPYLSSPSRVVDCTSTE
ncbi:hypothetical protein OSB04_021547 [Centaurea solstitialis]|uniref:Protein kinase domain-containing protein n=1 Tax=Centaurea solstitialis TaxID=347529 RepID=A0AA38WGC6_9ASTR|nr:hypothetical protein OSB04_021547 [Centaurea solstitialis]